MLEISSAQTSCGFGVPEYEFKGRRSHMADWSAQKGEQGLLKYQSEHNQQSIDGLPTMLFETPVKAEAVE